MEKYLLFGILIIFLLLIILIAYRFTLKQEMRFNELINHNNLKFNEYTNSLINDVNKQFLSFQNDMTNNLYTLDKNTNKSLFDVSEQMNSGMRLNFEKTNKSFVEISKQLVSINETQKNLDDLSKDIIDLQNILTDKKTRGLFGEVELYSILKNAYGLDERFYKKQYTLSNGSIADAVLMAESPLNKIVIDSKFPLENYLRMHDENLAKNERVSATNQFRRDIKKHIDDIKNKYLIKNETAEMAYLFIPAEAIFAEINGSFPDLLEYSYQAKVYLVSPTTLMAFITAIKAIYLGVKQNANLDLIQEEYNRLGDEFTRFVKRYDDLNNSFKKMSRDFRDLEITNNKIVKRFEEIKAVNLDKEDKNE